MISLILFFMNSFFAAMNIYFAVVLSRPTSLVFASLSIFCAYIMFKPALTYVKEKL